MVNFTSSINRGRLGRTSEIQAAADRRAQAAERARLEAARAAAIEQHGAIAGDPDLFRTLTTAEQRGQRIGMERERLDFQRSQAEREQLAANAQRLGALAAQRIASGADPLAAFDAAAPVLVNGFGMSEQEVAGLRAAVQQNPEAAPDILRSLGGVAAEDQPGFTPRGAPGEFVINGQRVFGQPGIDAQGNFTVMPAEGVREARDPVASTASAPRARGNPINVIGPDGQERTVIPMSDGTFRDANFTMPAAQSASAREAAEQQEAGIARVDNTVRRLATIYGRLNELGGVVDRRSGRPLQNLGAALARGTPGADTMLAALGREGGSLANEIEGMRATLISSLIQATGMSARAIDSNRELQFYLNTATTPTSDIMANYAAIYALDQNFGSGNVLEDILSPEDMAEVRRRAGELQAQAPKGFDTDGLPAPEGVDPADWEYMTPEERALWQN